MRLKKQHMSNAVTMTAPLKFFFFFIIIIYYTNSPQRGDQVARSHEWLGFWWKHASHVTPAGVVSQDVWEPLSYINRATEVQYVLIASDITTIASLKAWVTGWMLKKLLYFYPFLTYSFDRPTAFYNVRRRIQFPYLGKSKSISLQFWYKTVSIWKILYKYEIKVVHTDCLKNCCKK